MQISEVSEILGLCRFLRVPKHVFITDEKVWAQEDGITHYRGLQPKSKSDSMFLTAQADESTPIHEAIHAMMGLDEFGTDILTRAVMRKNEVIRNFPMLKSLMRREVKYRKVESSEEYPWAHQPRFQQRVEHYVLA